MLLWTLGCVCLLELVFLFYSDIFPGVGMLDHMVVLFLVVWENSILSSSVYNLLYVFYL